MSDTAAAEKPAPSTIGGLGGLGGFQPIAGGKFGDLLQVISMAPCRRRTPCSGNLPADGDGRAARPGGRAGAGTGQP